jgi:Mg2+/Co2+ transporter CorC
MLWAKWIGTPLYFLSNLLYPFVQFTIESSTLIEKRFARVNEDNEEEVMQKPEEQLAEESNDAQDVSLLKGILKFRTIIVRQIMKSRLDMVCVQKKISLDQLLRIVRDARYCGYRCILTPLIKSKGFSYGQQRICRFFYIMERTSPGNRQIRPAYFVRKEKFQLSDWCSSKCI